MSVNIIILIGAAACSYYSEELERHDSSIDRFVLELFFTRPKFPNDVTFLISASHDELVCNQSLQTHRAPGVDPSSADTNLCPKPIPIAISKARACIDECTSRVNSTTEYRCGLLGLSNDAICVMRRMRVDELNGWFKWRHSSHRKNERKVLDSIRSWRGWLDMRLQVWWGRGQ